MDIWLEYLLWIGGISEDIEWLVLGGVRGNDNDKKNGQTQDLQDRIHNIYQMR